MDKGNFNCTYSIFKQIEHNHIKFGQNGCKNFLLNINRLLCLENELGFCTVKLRHNYIALNRKKTFQAKKHNYCR